MNNTFSSQQISQTGNLDANLLLRQHKLNLMARFMQHKSVSPKEKQTEIARDIGYSSSTLQRFRQGLKIQNPYKSNNPTKRLMTSNDLKRPQTTSKEPVMDSVKSKRKISFKSGNSNDDNPNQAGILVE